MTIRSLPAVALASIILAACSGAANPSSPTRLQVVASTTVLADLVANVGGSRVSVSSIVPANGDVHTYSPRQTTPGSSRRLGSRS